MVDVEVYGKMLSTLPADDDHPYRSGAWRPQHVEYDAEELQVQGELPDDLHGEEDLSDLYTKFGTIHNGYGGRPYRYNYAATNEPGWFTFNGLVKHDTLTGRAERYQFEPGVFCSEVGVAPRVGGTEEDDAYLVTLTVDMNRDLSECVVFRANDVGRGPIARAQLPERIASGTHSCWAPGESIAGW